MRLRASAHASFHNPQPYQLSLPAATAWQERFVKNPMHQILQFLFESCVMTRPIHEDHSRGPFTVGKPYETNRKTICQPQPRQPSQARQPSQSSRPGQPSQPAQQAQASPTASPTASSPGMLPLLLRGGGGGGLEAKQSTVDGICSLRFYSE